MNARIERNIAPLQCVERHRSGHHGRREHLLELEQRRERECRRHLSAVDEGKALLRTELQRLQALLRERFGGGPDLTVSADRAEPQNRQRQVGERRQIARGAHRALGRNARMQPRVDESREEPHQLAADAREPLQEARELEHQDEPDHPIVQQRAGSGAV